MPRCHWVNYYWVFFLKGSQQTMEWKMCLDFFLHFFPLIWDQGLLFEELISGSADELQVAFCTVVWSFIILQYVFCQFQGGSFEAFLAGLWMWNVTGTFQVFIWGHGMALCALSTSALRYLLKHSGLLMGTMSAECPKGHPHTMEHLQMNCCVFYMKWLCDWRQKINK